MTAEQFAVPFTLLRGGTSKAVFLRAGDLPEDRRERDALILALFGSPDPRQIDGLGGADLLTSKCAIIGPPTVPDADLDYTFAQVSIDEPFVDYDINCGNISAAVGAFAVDEGIVSPSGDTAPVRIHNTNTGRILIADVPLIEGKAAVEGNCAVQGVPGSGAPIGLDFSLTAGGVTGRLLPTGNVVDQLEIPSGSIPVTIVDLGNLSVFMHAEDVGMSGAEAPDDMTDQQFARIADVKQAAADRIGIDGSGLIPVPAVVAPPHAFRSFATGEVIEADAIDLLARVIGGRPPVLHKAYPGTVGACTAAAACIEGSVVAAALKPVDGAEIRIGHTSGVMPVRAAARLDGGNWHVEQAAYLRTARRLAEGTAFVRSAAIEGGRAT